MCVRKCTCVGNSGRRWIDVRAMGSVVFGKFQPSFLLNMHASKISYLSSTHVPKHCWNKVPIRKENRESNSFCWLVVQDNITCKMEIGLSSDFYNFIINQTKLLELIRLTLLINCWLWLIEFNICWNLWCIFLNTTWPIHNTVLSVHSVDLCAMIANEIINVDKFHENNLITPSVNNSNHSVNMKQLVNMKQ